MTEIIDSEGNLLGRWNVVDVLVVLFVLAIAISGIALASGGPIFAAAATETTHVTVEKTVQPAVADALASAHPAPESGVVEVGDVRVIDVFAVNTTEYTNATEIHKVVRVSLVLETATRDGLAYYGGERLYVGQGVRVDLTTVVLDGTVVAMGGGGGHE